MKLTEKQMALEYADIWSRKQRTTTLGCMTEQLLLSEHWLSVSLDELISLLLDKPISSLDEQSLISLDIKLWDDASPSELVAISSTLSLPLSDKLLDSIAEWKHQCMRVHKHTVHHAHIWTKPGPGAGSFITRGPIIAQLHYTWPVYELARRVYELAFNISC